MALRADVPLIEPERMNLLGLVLAGLAARRLQDPVAARHAHALDGDVTVSAGQMQATMRFCEGRVEVLRGRTSRAVATIGGGLPDLVEMVRGRRLLRAVLSRRVRVWGDPRALWHVLRFLGTK